jgi:hypothetical protein
LLGQRTDIPPPPPGVEFDRSEDPFALVGQDAESYVATHAPPVEPAGPPPSRGFAFKNILRGGLLLLVLGPMAWGFIDGALNGAERDDSGTIAKAGDLEVTDLRVGDCFDMAPGDETATDVTEVVAVPCSDPHENEVYVATNYVGSDSYPGEATIWDYANQFCITAFDTFVDIAYEDSLLDFGYFYPSEEGWAQGDHAITCVLYDFNGTPLTGSMRGAAR